jgi:hypothetical protein
MRIGSRHFAPSHHLRYSSLKSSAPHLKESRMRRTVSRILVSLLALIVLILAIAYLDGRALPVNHVTTVTGTIPAPPAKVFALIANVAAAPTWRPAVKSVQVLPPVYGPQTNLDHWTEDLGHGQTMTFLAVRSEPSTRRDVLLDVPGASYGGTWTYELSPGPTPNTTTLKITESGFINPPMYRFMMQHIFGMTHNLDVYMSDLRTEAPKL